MCADFLERALANYYANMINSSSADAPKSNPSLMKMRLIVSACAHTLFLGCACDGAFEGFAAGVDRKSVV